MIKAGSLTYAIFAALVTSIICGLMIMLAYTNRTYFHNMDTHVRLRDNAYSGVALAMASKLGDFKHWQILEGLDSIQVGKRKWGAFEVIFGRAKKGKNSYTKTALVGAQCKEFGTAALWLKDANQSLQVSGDALIKGDAFLPLKGIKRAHVEGTYYSREKLYYGKRLSSKMSLPEPQGNLEEYWQQYLNKYYTGQDSVLGWKRVKEKLNHPFDKQTLVYYSLGPVRLFQGSFRGNIIIQSGTSITLGAGCRLDQVILIAPKIIVESGVQASVHLVASDTISVKSGAELKYPSSIILTSHGPYGGYCKVMKNAQVYGIIASFREQPSHSNNLNLELEDKCLVRGQVYCQGNLEIGGKVEGTVFAEKFLLVTPSGVYENLLLNGQINREVMPAELPALQMGNSTYFKILARWM